MSLRVLNVCPAGRFLPPRNHAPTDTPAHRQQHNAHTKLRDCVLLPTMSPSGPPSIFDFFKIGEEKEYTREEYMNLGKVHGPCLNRAVNTTVRSTRFVVSRYFEAAACSFARRFSQLEFFSRAGRPAESLLAILTTQS